MIQYNPQVNDMRGEYMMQAAQANASMMNNLGQDIGGALAGIGEMYGEIEGRKAKGRAFKDVFKVISPSLGISMEQLEAISGGKIKSDMDWANVSDTISPWIPSIANSQLGRYKLGVQQQQPFVNAGLKNAANIAGGNATYTPPAGMAPVEPPLPVADENLPAVGGAPMTAPSSSIPGGQSSIDAINRDRQRRGLPPIK
jgi:hypothetical protein